jgi:hypothetical protein
MPLTPIIRTAGGIALFALRHALAMAVTIVLPCVLWTLLYLVLLLWAILTDSGIGSPVAYPLGLLFVAAWSAFMAVVFFFPSTSLAALVTSRMKWAIFWQIPLCLTLFALISGVLALTMGAQSESPAWRDTGVGFGLFYAAHLLPLGLYWWTAQSLPVFQACFRKIRDLWRKRRQQDTLR